VVRTLGIPMHLAISHWHDWQWQWVLTVADWATTQNNQELR
jgi:hypothetical protein